MRAVLIASLFVLLAGCGGGGHPVPRVPAGNPSPPVHVEPDDNEKFVFHPAAPHADPLPEDPQDLAQPPSRGYRDGAGVFVYASRGGAVWVLLARRATWLSAPGTWGVFGGSVESGDRDSAGHLSFARAGEHELYEESVTVYHQTDANALRACPAHLKHWRSGGRFRTFFSRQRYVPASTFNEGYAYAVRQRLSHTFRENDQYCWVPLDELKAAALARTRTAPFTDPEGNRQSMELFSAFFGALTDPGYVAQLDALP